MHLISRTKNKFDFNPFSGLSDDEIDHTIVPIFSLSEIQSLITQKVPVIIEFQGKKGRGKTTHLTWLHNQLKIPIIKLNPNSTFEEINLINSNIILLDGIYNLSFYDRIRLFKADITIIYTTHFTRRWEAFIAGKRIISFCFKGINLERLEKIVLKRMTLAKTNDGTKIIKIPDQYLFNLIKIHSDNYRKIISILYKNFNE